MKNSRLQEIEGYFHGIKYRVKPTPLNIDEKQEELGDMLRAWYKEHEPKVLESSNILDQDAEDMTPEQLKELVELLDGLNGWKKDEEFRGEYLKKMATTCMEFEKPVPKELWASGDIAWSTIREAWDFFTERRSIPQSGLHYT